MIKLEPMNKFIIKGGRTILTCNLLNPTFLVVMLGSTMLAKSKSFEEKVQSNKGNILICRDHSERYAPYQMKEIMSKGI